jgi:hypothetical protein
MLNTSQTCPRTLALFQKRVEGDDALLALAALRFRQAGLDAEFYADTPDELERLWRFTPSEAYATVHLNRGLNMLAESSRDLVIDFANRFQGRVAGLVMHDQPEMVSERVAYVRAAEALALRLEKIANGPHLFVEYAAGLEPDGFIDFFERTRRIASISACIDVGHVGIWEARQSYSRNHRGEDVCGLTPDHSQLPDLVADVQEAVRCALPATVRVIKELSRLGNPLHYHLHDGHPLSTFSPYGVSDHLSFLFRIPIPFEHDGKWSLQPMYGPAGLFELVSRACEELNSSSPSFTLEIHVPDGRLPLRDAEHLFAHWRDKTNAERMNRWLWMLLENCQLLEAAVAGSQPRK